MIMYVIRDEEIQICGILSPSSNDLYKRKKENIL